MPVTAREFRNFVGHACLGVGRFFTRAKPEAYIDKYQGEGLVLKSVSAPSGECRRCHICGYAIAEFSVADGWVFQTCSAYTLKTVYHNQSFARWAAKLESLNAPPPSALPLAASMASKGDVTRSG